MRPSPSWRLPAALGAVVVLGLGVAVVLLALVGSDGEPAGNAANAPMTESTVQTSTPPTTAVDDLERRYRACALDRGFDPDFVQVLRYEGERDGPPRWVKTGREVPAAVHVPCFHSIGGTLEEPWSSYGNER